METMVTLEVQVSIRKVKATEVQNRGGTYKTPTRKTVVTAYFCDREICKVHTKGRGITRRTMSVRIFGTAVPTRNFLMSKQWPCTLGFQRELAGTHLKIAPSSYWTVSQYFYSILFSSRCTHSCNEPGCHHSEHNIKRDLELGNFEDPPVEAQNRVFDQGDGDRVGDL